MFPAPIERYLRPHTVAEALNAIAEYEAGDGVFIAGGQSLMQAIKSRMLRPRCIIDLQSIAELKGMHFEQGTRIGAMTRYVEIAAEEKLNGALAALRDAAAHVGDRQVRNRGTIGGSICWNFVISCMPAVVLALDGTMQLMASNGDTRSLAADDFILAGFETARAEDEILIDISWPSLPKRSGSAYKKWGLVTDSLPVVGVCVSVCLDETDHCSAARITLSGLTNGAQRVVAGEQALLGSAGDNVSLTQVFETIAEAVDTQSDQWSDATHRQQLIRTIGIEVAATAFNRARR